MGQVTNFLWPIFIHYLKLIQPRHCWIAEARGIEGGQHTALRRCAESVWVALKDFFGYMKRHVD